MIDSVWSGEVQVAETINSRREFLKRSGLVLSALTLGAGLALADDDNGGEGNEGEGNDNGGVKIQAAGKGIIDLGASSSFKVGRVLDRGKDAGAVISSTTNGLIAVVPICTHQVARLTGMPPRKR